MYKLLINLYTIIDFLLYTVTNRQIRNMMQFRGINGMGDEVMSERLLNIVIIGENARCVFGAHISNIYLQNISPLFLSNDTSPNINCQ